MSTSSASSVPTNQAIDLSWVEFSEEEAEPCCIPDCSMETVWIAYWKVTCTCWGEEYLYCDEHGLKFKHNVGLDKLCIDCLSPIKLFSLDRIPR